MTRVREERGETVWYVHAQGRVWGPYAGERMEGFVEEGRVAAGALVADHPDGPFAPAGEDPRLNRLFLPRAPAIQSPAPRSAAPTAVERAAETTPSDVSGRVQPALDAAGAARPLLVFAALGSLDDAALQPALAMHGPFEKIGPGLWLVKARSGPAALRNALSRRLRGEDMLLVVEASLANVAWFNVDQAAEGKVRALWSE